MEILSPLSFGSRSVREMFQITGRFDMETAFRLSLNLKSGKLPARISLESVDKLEAHINK